MSGKKAEPKKVEGKEDPSQEQMAKDQDDTDRALGNGAYARDPMTGLTKEALADKNKREAARRA